MTPKRAKRSLNLAKIASWAKPIVIQRRLLVRPLRAPLAAVDGEKIHVAI